MFRIPIRPEFYGNNDNLQEMFETLRYITSQINEGIAAIDRHGVVIFWNRFMEERYDIPASSIVGKKMDDLLTGTISWKVLSKKTPMNDIYYIKNHNGKELYAFVQANPVFYKDEFMGVVCIEMDITDVTNLSRELEITREKLKYLESEINNKVENPFDSILGRSNAIEKSKSIARQVAMTNTSIMLYGESGTGKEVFARAIHKYSNRDGTFIPVNCSAIPQELFESEFFGYAPGAFTGATRNGKSGIFELANNGTIFLDEIADMPLNMQVKLLRVLQEKAFMRVGGNELINVNVRVIAATNKDIGAMVKKETFREDLYYRLNVIEIKLPPLRERVGDVGILIRHFLEEECRENNKSLLRIDRDAMKILEKYRWKGNVRELKNTIENMVVLSSSDVLGIEDIPEYIINSIEKPTETNYPMDLNSAIEILEKNKIIEALKLSEGNKSKAANLLNIPRSRLYQKIEKYNINNMSKK